MAGKNIEDMAMHGINRLLSMQTPSGGFGFWPGDTNPTQWGTANVVHLLQDAQKAGYSIAQDRIDDAVRYLELELDKLEHDTSAHGGDWKYRGDPEPYMQFVLARAGKGRKARIQKLVDGLPKSLSEEALESEYMLKAALYLSGDRRYERDLRSPDVSPVSEFRSNSWTFYSDRRRRGFTLSTFVDLFGQDAAAQSLADVVAGSLRGHPHGYYNTQEVVWGTTGLGKFVAGGADNYAPPVLKANGRTVDAQKVAAVKGKGSGDLTWSLGRASEYKTLTLSLPEIGKGKLFLLISSDGVRENQTYEVGGKGIDVSRRALAPEGSPMVLDDVPLGDLVVMELTLSNRTSETVNNVALVDRFGAGFEIENPRLGRGGVFDWIDPEQLWKPDYMNIRDDRIELFGPLKAGESVKVIYAVRAVTAGRFVTPPVEAAAMYDPRIWAREVGTPVTIQGPWNK